MNDKVTENEALKNEKMHKGIISRMLANERTLGIIVILGLVGIFLIFISSYINPSSNSVSDTDEGMEDDPPTSTELENYRNSISEELGNMLASMDGVGKTKVMVTLDGTVRNVYATDVDVNGRETSRKNGGSEDADKQNTEKKSCIVIRQNDGSEKALTIGQLMPQIKGVLVICEGGDSDYIKEKIVDAVSAALDISETHICVSKLG